LLLCEILLEFNILAVVAGCINDQSDSYCILEVSAIILLYNESIIYWPPHTDLHIVVLILVTFAKKSLMLFLLARFFEPYEPYERISF